MCFTNKRKRNWIRKVDRVSDPVRPPGQVKYGGAGHHTMSVIFHDMLGHHMEIYIDDIVVKSKKAIEHVNHLRKSF